MMEWILGLLAVAIGGLLWVGWRGNDSMATPVQYGHCQGCGKRIDKQALFLVYHKRVCGTCGAQRVREVTAQNRTKENSEYP